MSCKFCDRLPFRTKIGLAVHMTDEHGVNSDGVTDSDGELEEVRVVRRSSRDIPSHLDYREVETNDEEGEASENEVSKNEMNEQIRRRKSRKPKKRNVISKQFYIPQEILSAKNMPQGEST